MTDVTARYVIWSNEHGRWWRSNQCGYTAILSEAGRYCEIEATAICDGANIAIDEDAEPNEVMLLAPEAMIEPDLPIGHARYRIDVHHDTAKLMDEIQTKIGLNSHLEVIQKGIQLLVLALDPSTYVRRGGCGFVALKIQSPDLGDTPG